MLRDIFDILPSSSDLVVSVFSVVYVGREPSALFVVNNLGQVINVLGEKLAVETTVLGS